MACRTWFTPTQAGIHEGSSGRPWGCAHQWEVLVWPQQSQTANLDDAWEGLQLRKPNDRYMIGYHWVSKSSKGCLQPEGRFSCTQRRTSLKSSCPKLQGTKLTVHPMLIVSPGMIPHTSVVEHLAIERLETIGGRKGIHAE